MTPTVRRLGFGAALATGLSLLGLSIGGMASIDADLRAAAEQRPGGERVSIVDVDRRCDRDRERAVERAAERRDL
ncbi:MAG TPA: hypothetical protein VGW10_20160 [Solirubrobacteraceae bacterium]|nr:hypothetical protein [Solirubrobacteraceae bacterium]